MSPIIDNIQRLISQFLFRLYEDLDPDIRQIMLYFNDLQALKTSDASDIVVNVLSSNVKRKGALIGIGLLARIYTDVDYLFKTIWPFTRSSNLHLKQEAFLTLGLLSLSPSFVKGEEILKEVLRSRSADEYAMRGALLGLAFTNHPLEDALDLIAQFLEDENPWLRRTACLALIALIIKNDIQKSDILRSKAAFTLGIIEAGEGDQELSQFFHVISLIEAMNYELSVENLGSQLDLEELYSRLKKVLSDSDADVRRAASFGFALLRSLNEPAKLYVFLNSLLKSSSRGIRQGACVGLGLLASKLAKNEAQIVIDVLMSLAKYSEGSFLLQCSLLALSIAFIHLGEEELLFIKEKLNDSDTFSIRAVCTGLGCIGGKREPYYLKSITSTFGMIMPYLPSLLSHSDPWVKRTATFLLTGLKLSLSTFLDSKTQSFERLYLFRIFSLSFGLSLMYLGDSEASLFLLCLGSS
ncbi:MAG: HEAT repeat domain-containing protein [Promethearchaeota archaeon]